MRYSRNRGIETRERCLRVERERDDSPNKREMLREEEKGCRRAEEVRDGWRRGVFLKSEVGFVPLLRDSNVMYSTLTQILLTSG